MVPEFTTELDAEYLRKLLGPIEDTRGVRRGAARREAFERGLTGDPYEAALVGRADTDVDRLKADTQADFAYNRAGLQREERLLGEERTYGSAEAEKGRAFVAQQGEIQRAHERSLMVSRGRDGFLQSLLGLGGSVAGGFIGRKFGGF